MSMMDFNSFNESTTDLRRYLDREPNFGEKGKELESGGKLDDKLSNILVTILSEIKKEIPGLKVTVTAGNDKYHAKLGVSSKHKLGKAVDFVISPDNSTNIEKVKKILDKFAVGNKGFAYLDEYTKPSKYSTGKHFHVSYDPSNPEGSHARKVSVQSSKPSPVYFDRKPSYTSDKNVPIDTWAGFIQRLTQNR